MSQKKWVRVAIGILASSGVAVILSGGALAADGGQDTASQKTLTQQGMGASGPQGRVMAQGTSNNQQSSQYYSNDSWYSAGDTSSSDPGNSGSVSHQGGVTQDNGYNGSGTNTNSAQVSNSSGSKPSQASGGSENDNSKGSVPSQSVSSSKSYMGVAGGTLSGGSGSAANAANVAAVPEMAVITSVPSSEVPSAGTSAQAATRTTMMPIQPVITNRTSPLAPDLAESMPSAPAPAKAPVPTKSTGVLAGLVVGLSNVVVPQPVTPVDSVSLKLILGVSLLTLVVLLANVFEFSYGQWLRRGGFATAARSDEPLNSFTSPLFATPLLSGYVKQPPRLHSPILMLVLVPNAYRKEDRR